MGSLKEVLTKDHSKKKKAELIDLLSGLEKALTPEVYERISGVAPSELNGLTKAEILAIIEEFGQNYDGKWESALSGVSNDVLKAIFEKMDADEQAFRAANVSNGAFAAEMGSIDFAKIIGGPLDACVKAQSNASVSTVSFINEVGFDVDEGGAKTLRMVDFSYTRNIANPDYINEEDTPGVPERVDEVVTINVPFISLLNVPSFRIETCEIDFNVKLNSTYTQKTDSEFGINTSTSGGSGGIASLFAKVNFKVDVSYKRTTSTGIKVEKEYSLGVKVRATNDEMPAGLEKVLGLLSA